jgi:hypothetical protein
MNTTSNTQPKAAKKLSLNKETIRQLTTAQGTGKQIATPGCGSYTC